MKPKFFTQLSIAVFFLLVKSVPAYSQTGCTDPLANNYNSAATTNNGSCTYNTTTYAPPVKVDPISSTLVESSGLQMADNSLWSFNDGGGAAAIYRIDTISNTLLQTVNLGGATNVDWEDIAFDGTYFYVGDFGNNANGARTNLKIYKFALSAIPAYSTNPTDTIPAAQIEVINFKYNNQPQPPVSSAANNTKYDCEAMIVDNGIIHLFSKNWINLNTTHYVINSTLAGTYTADSVETLATNYLVTAADKAPGQNIVVLLGYQTTGLANHFIHILSGYSDGKYFNGNKRRIDLPDASQMGQAEGITFRNERYGYISNEKLSAGFFTVNQKLRSFNISNFVTASAGSTLAISSTSLKGWQRNEGIELDWQGSAEADNKFFEVEKSKDGQQFIEAASIPAHNSAGRNYTWFDTNPYQGNNFYRIKNILKSGDIKYSAIINVKVGSEGGSIDVFPNPVKNRNVTLRITNQNKGSYTLRLFNDAGQQVYIKTIKHEGGSSSQTLQFNSGLVKGVYQLQISNGEKTTSQRIEFN